VQAWNEGNRDKYAEHCAECEQFSQSDSLKSWKASILQRTKRFVEHTGESHDSV
jgi:hypothetical protein